MVVIASVDDARPLLDGVDAEALARSVDELLVFRSQPGTSASLYAMDTGECLFSVYRNADGTVETTDAMGGISITLPEPQPSRKVGGRPSMNIGYYVAHVVQRHLIDTVCRMNGVDHVDDVVDGLVGRAVSNWTSRQSRALNARLRARITYRNFEDAVRALLVQVVWALSKDRRGKVVVPRYNKAMRSHASVAELLVTNPGAAGWLMNSVQSDEQSIKHPGQGITKVRRSAERAGIDQRYWRTVVRLPPETMQILTASDVPRYAAAIIINACGDMDVTLSPDTARTAVSLFVMTKARTPWLAAPRRNEEVFHAKARELLRSAMRLLVVAQPGGAETQDQVERLIDLADYMAACVVSDEEIRARTYAGLHRAVARWHRRDRQQQIALAEQRRLAEQDGWYERWTSLVETLQVPPEVSNVGGDVSVIALQDVHSLLAEGDDMAHCVGGYASQCIRGKSRVFSIRHDGKPVATTELAMRNGRWQAVQTRGFHNNHVDGWLTQVAAHLARQYQSSWDEGRGDPHRHRAWLQHPETDDTLPVTRTY